MITVIPNWHPIFVHFTVALIIISALMHVLHLFVDGDAESLKIKTATVANWNLWLGAILTLFTILAGWFAYNSVEHDAPSHAAMTLHKNWAFSTAAFIIVVAIWSFQQARWAVRLSKPIVFATVLAAALVGATAWLGGEVVYRYGLGVMSLPKTDSHSHAAGSGDHAHGGEKSANDHGDAAPHGHGDEAPHGHDASDANQHDSLDAAPSTDSTMAMPKKSAGDGHESLDADSKKDKTEEHSHSQADPLKKLMDDGHGHSHADEKMEKAEKK